MASVTMSVQLTFILLSPVLSKMLQDWPFYRGTLSKGTESAIQSYPKAVIQRRLSESDYLEVTIWKQLSESIQSTFWNVKQRQFAIEGSIMAETPPVKSN